ncbi:MAG TPA: tripartite tricarboxylate transporter permease, partial [Candidatus Nanoarchaeia archaeon]|nr:tripartite tricarboxylate transporter permease [Candidatus Nanoarchaeia archaeon]
LATCVGIMLGIITGLVPGIHVNLVSTFILSISGMLLAHTSPFLLCVAILAMAVTHTFLDTLPSIFLGVPQEETVLSMLPGHRLLLQGKGTEAVLLSVFGSLGSMILAIPLVPILVYVLRYFYSIFEPFIGWILVAVCLFMIFREKEKIDAVVLFCLSGALGIAVLRLPLTQSLLPLLSGLFGVSMLCMSLRNNVWIPKQERSELSLEDVKKALPCAVIFGGLASFLPGLGPAQAATISSSFVKLTERGFLILTGGLATVNMVLSLVMFYVLDKARNGAVVAMSEMMHLSFFDFLIFLNVALIAGGVATILAIFFSGIFSSLISFVPYTKMCFFVLCFVIGLVFLLTSWMGILILFVSAAVGLVAHTSAVAKSHMMGCLLVPVILYFLF